MDTRRDRCPPGRQASLQGHSSETGRAARTAGNKQNPFSSPKLAKFPWEAANTQALGYMRCWADSAPCCSAHACEPWSTPVRMRLALPAPAAGNSLQRRVLPATLSCSAEERAQWLPHSGPGAAGERQGGASAAGHLMHLPLLLLRQGRHMSVLEELMCLATVALQLQICLVSPARLSLSHVLA